MSDAVDQSWRWWDDCKDDIKWTGCNGNKGCENTRHMVSVFAGDRYGEASMCEGRIQMFRDKWGYIIQ